MGSRRLTCQTILVILPILTACIDDDVIDAPGIRPQWTVENIPDSEIREDPPMLAIARQLPTFGGFYFDDQDRIVINLTDLKDFERAKQLIQPHLGAHRPSAGYVARQVQHSFLKLARFRTVLRGHVFKIPGVASLGVKESQNIIRVGVRDAVTENAVRGLFAKVGVPEEVVQFRQGVEPARRDDGLWSTQSQVKGGLRIYYVDGGVAHPCTLGFPALRWSPASSSYQSFFTTNSHCTPEPHEPGSALFYQAGTYFGIESDDPYAHSCGFIPDPCRNADVALISAAVPIQLGRIGRPSSSCSGEDSDCPVATAATDQVIQIDANNPTFNVMSRGETYENETLHKVGAITGWTHGVVEETCEDYGHDFFGWVAECSDRVDYARHGGDSGAPVFYRMGTGNNVELRGIHWGSYPYPPYYDAIMSDLHQIELDLGELIVYDPGPMTISISGPGTVTSSQTCTWIATIYGGLKPIGGQWSGALSSSFDGAAGNGASTQVTGTVTASSWLNISVTDYYGRTANASTFVSVEQSAQNNCYY